MEQWYCPNCGRPSEDAWEFDPESPPFYRSSRTVIYECECGALIEDGYFIGKSEMLYNMKECP